MLIFCQTLLPQHYGLYLFVLAVKYNTPRNYYSYKVVGGTALSMQSPA